MGLEFFKSADRICVLIVFTYETNIKVILIQYVLENTTCECRHTDLSVLAEDLSHSPITGCSGLFCTDLLSSVHTGPCQEHTWGSFCEVVKMRLAGAECLF